MPEMYQCLDEVEGKKLSKGKLGRARVCPRKVDWQPQWQAARKLAHSRLRSVCIVDLLGGRDMRS